MSASGGATIVKLADVREARRRALDAYPLNRLGKTPAWAVWVVTREIPQDLAAVCAVCGHYGLTPHEARELYGGLWARAYGMSALEFIAEMTKLGQKLTREFGLLATVDLSAMPMWQPIDAGVLIGPVVWCAPCAAYGAVLDIEAALQDRERT